MYDPQCALELSPSRTFVGQQGVFATAFFSSSVTSEFPNREQYFNNWFAAAQAHRAASAGADGGRCAAIDLAKPFNKSTKPC